MPTALTAPTATAPAPATTWDAVRVLLEDQRVDCVRQRELALAQAATSLPDPVVVRRVASLLRTIEEIDDALQRITDGTYGVCAHCRGDIPVERLEFRPYAATCVACQQPTR
jgi:DnaK suppressor protein